MLSHCDSRDAGCMAILSFPALMEPKLHHCGTLIMCLLEVSLDVHKNVISEDDSQRSLIRWLTVELTLGYV
jgi:hypothetical protein